MLEQLSVFDFGIYLGSFLLLRYLLVAGLLYLVFWKWQPASLARFKIQENSRRRAIPRTEIFYSLLTIVVVSLWGSLLFYIYKLGALKIYTDINSHSMTYFVVSVFLAFVIHDIYFYFSHRAMHRPWLLKHVHAVHHRSMNPTPFATFSFHPAEALIENFFLLPLLVLVPMHPYALATFLFLTFFFNANGHLGYEMLPRGTWDRWWGSWLTTTTHHNLHHQYFNANYALYGRHWDIVFRTLHSKTREEFLRTKSEPKQLD